MKLIRKMLIGLVVAVLILIMYGSATNHFSVQQMLERKWGHASVEKEKKEVVKFPEYIKDKTGYLQFDAQVESHGVTKVALGTAECYSFPFKERKDLMNRMLTVLSPKKGWKASSEDKKYDEFIYHIGDQDYGIDITSFAFSYYSPFYQKISRCIDIPMYDGSEEKDRYEPYETKKKFSFQSEKEARDQIFQLVQLSGISIDGEYDCHTYYMDHTLMKDMQYEMGKDGKEDTSHYSSDWSEQDDAYYFCMRQTFHGIPVYTDVVGRGGYNSSTYFSNLIGLVDQTGIQYVGCRTMLKMEQSEEEDPLPMDQIVDAIKDHYEPVAKADPTVEYSVNRIELMEAAVKHDDGSYDLVPAWICFIKQDTPEMEVAYYEQILINAITGQEITQVYEEW